MVYCNYKSHIDDTVTYVTTLVPGTLKDIPATSEVGNITATCKITVVKTLDETEDQPVKDPIKDPTKDPVKEPTTEPEDPPHSHTFKQKVIKASPGNDGATYEECGEQRNYKKIIAPKTMTLSSYSFTYNGKEQVPKAKMKARNGEMISESNYTVSYPKSKYVGCYNVVVRFKGNYQEQMTKTFDILPKTTKLSKISAGKKMATIQWKKQTTQTNGYQIQYSLSNKFLSANKTVTISKNSTTKAKIKNLKSKKKYYVRIRTYKKQKYNGKNITLYSAWSSAKSAKIK